MKPPLTSSPIPMQAGTFEHRSLSRDRWRKSISAFQQHSPSSRYFGLSYCCWSYVMSIFGVIFSQAYSSEITSHRCVDVGFVDVVLRYGKWFPVRMWNPMPLLKSSFQNGLRLYILFIFATNAKKKNFYWCLVPKASDKERPMVNFLLLAHSEREKKKEKRMYELTWQVVQER